MCASISGSNRTPGCPVSSVARYPLLRSGFDPLCRTATPRRMWCFCFFSNGLWNISGFLPPAQPTCLHQTWNIWTSEPVQAECNVGHYASTTCTPEYIQEKKLIHRLNKTETKGRKCEQQPKSVIYLDILKPEGHLFTDSCWGPPARIILLLIKLHKTLKGRQKITCFQKHLCRLPLHNKRLSFLCT